MAFDFPSSPTVGQQYTPAGGPTYTYNGVGWVLPGGGGNVSNSGAGTLNDAIVGAGCPTVSTSVGKSDDRATWSFVPGENATAEQVLAGENVVATIPIEPLTTVSTGDFISRFTNAEYLALQKRRTTDNGKMAKD